MRPGRSMISATNDGSDAPSAGAGEEVVVAEEAAAFLIRERAAEIVEVIEPQPDDDTR